MGGFLSKFFHGQEQLEDNYKQKQEEAKELAKQGKAKNVTMQAIDNVMHVRQVRQYYKDLEHMVRYELGMPDLWVEIQAERDKIIKEQKEINRLQKEAERQEELKRQEKFRRIKEKLHIYVALVCATIYIVVAIWFITLLIEYDRKWRWGF